MNSLELWNKILTEAKMHAEEDSFLAPLLIKHIISQKSFKDALCSVLSNKLSCDIDESISLHKIIKETYTQDAHIVECACIDLQATFDRDPAIDNYCIPLLFLKGYHALQAYRIAHQQLKNNRKYLALHIQSVVSQSLGVDIHPAAQIGKGIMIDHATSLVIGETAVVEDDVSLLHEVTLGGTGKEQIDRHPKVRRGALIGAGAKILGNIEIGACSKIGAGSVVLENVPAHTTVVGVPAHIVGDVAEDTPSTQMDHYICNKD